MKTAIVNPGTIITGDCRDPIAKGDSITPRQRAVGYLEATFMAALQAPWQHRQFTCRAVQRIQKA